ncbi:hypothetical protein VMCG_00836 [Cytospora schulzeri]|uniref:Uncharacterized protein n=1 Tax=Cytospora schulzeri TaxID=448051 RepID=A0A423X7M7_9PEZI|nr:hypothetical protein VMCG_00836 [Valsa malicola]
MSRLLRQLSSSSLRRKSGVRDVLPDGDPSNLNVCQSRRSVSSSRKTRNINTTPKDHREFQVFLAAVDDRIDAGSRATWSGPPLLFDIDALRPNFSSLELAARMTLMFADEVCFSQLTRHSKMPKWDHDSLRAIALTFLRAWDVQYRS